MDEPERHNAKRKRPVTKDHVRFGSIYMKCPEEANLSTQTDLGAGKGGGRNEE